jgi:transcriptional regulator with XRE-family HTH domain
VLPAGFGNAGRAVVTVAGSFGQCMRDLMAERGLSQAELARRVPLSAAHLSRLATDARRPTPELAARIDTLLGADGRLAALAAQPTPPQPSTLLRPLDEGDAGRIRADVARLVALDTQHGSAGLLPVAQRAFRAAADRLSRAGATAGATADVHAAAADLAALVAWVAADDVRHDVSRQVALEGLALADIAGDRRLHEFLVSHLSMVAEHAGRPAEALAFADRGLGEGPSLLRVRAMFRMRRARALGQLGATDEGLLEWELARQMLEDASERAEEDKVTYWLHDSELAIHRAVILAEGGRAREAVEWSRQGVDLLPDAQGRDQALFRAMHLEDLVRARAWRDAEAVAQELAVWPGGHGSARVPAILRRVVGVLSARPGRGSALLREVVEGALQAGE